MIISVKFPIQNSIKLKHAWPIQIEAKTYFIEVRDGCAVAIGVRYGGLPTNLVPQFEAVNQGPVRGHIKLNGGNYLLMAEHELRAWQSIVSASVMFDIDFDSPTEDFFPETPEEKENIHFHNFGRTRTVRPMKVEEFAVLGRAFLAIEIGKPFIEVMAHYREGVRALLAERSIDAYNNFYLFLETQFCNGRTGTEQAANEFMKSQAFMTALKDVVAERKNTTKLSVEPFESLKVWDNEPRRLVKEIILLRGSLRHHSLNSPLRWDPDKQESYQPQAQFLALLANQIAFPMTTSKLWEPSLLQQFTALAEKMHMTTVVHVRMTIRENEHVNDVAVDMTFPQPGPDAELAKAVLKNALEILDQKSPGAELFAIRATIKSKGTELFRYDVGATIDR